MGCCFSKAETPTETLEERDCFSKAETPTETPEEREIRGLAEQGPNGMLDIYTNLVKGGGDIWDHYSFEHMSSSDQRIIADLFIGYASNQIAFAQEWQKDFNAKWPVFWATGSGSKWREGKSGRDTEKLFKLGNIGSLQA
jgi:hypothetical protein